ncbi:MAG: ABC transporter ATP-binding protein [Planctomycetota bacterium]
MPHAPPAIETNGLTRRLPSGSRIITILDAVDLRVEHGEVLAIIGPSGSGKSTLLALLAGLDRPTAGSVRIDGQALEGMSEDELALLRRSTIGFVFQSFHLIANFTALENVMLPLEIRGERGPRRTALDLLEQVGLGERSHHYPVQLSGGEQQRVALARAFAARPSILLADEPTGNLDTANGKAVIEMMTALQREHGTTLVIVTHDHSITDQIDRTIELQDGRIVSDVAKAAATDGTP